MKHRQPIKYKRRTFLQWLLRRPRVPTPTMEDLLIRTIAQMQINMENYPISNFLKDNTK
jgi:hypothetical protein